MIVAGLALAGLAALVHVYIFALESLLWSRPATRRTFGLRDAEESRVTRPLAFNQGFYNLFLAILVALGIVLVATGALAIGATLVFAGAGSMVAAGVVLMASSPRLARAALVQALPPLLGIVALLIGLLAAP